MRHFATAILSLFLLSIVARAGTAEDPRWVTFKTGHNSWGTIQHQIDRRTIRPEGNYRTFWTRMWRVEARTELVASYYGMLIFWSQKFAVDCPGRRFGRDFIDSNLPSERKRKVSLPAMHWDSLDKHPQVERAVCGKL